MRMKFYIHTRSARPLRELDVLTDSGTSRSHPCNPIIVSCEYIKVETIARLDEGGHNPCSCMSGEIQRAKTGLHHALGQRGASYI